MKFSKSIVVFLFLSSCSDTFFYALNRTDGNVLKSLQFALYFLAIKIGLIAPNIPLELNQDQPNQQLVSRVQPLLVYIYNPYVSVLDEYRPSGLYMSKVKRPLLVPQHSHFQKLINELRAGDSRLTQAAWLLITIWMLQQQSAGFQPINPVSRPPHIESARNLLFGKPKPDQFSCRQLSRFDHQEFKKMDPYSSLSKKNALALITEEYDTLEYPKFDYIDRSLGLIAPRQRLAAKTYHAPSYKLYPELYGISQAQIKAINDYGLVGYVERGGKLPSSAFIGAYHQLVKTFFARNKSTFNLNRSYRGEPVIIVHNEITGGVLIFRSDTKQLWTPSHLKPK